VARLAEVTVSCHDLENAPWPYPDLEFGGIVVVNYLFRPLFPALIKSLKKGGILIYETFTSGNERYGKPRNPDHLLRHGELLEVARGQLRVMAYEDLFVTHPKPAMIQHICAVKIVPPDSIG
jgi:SAM-dependent methyltransferase